MSYFSLAGSRPICSRFVSSSTLRLRSHHRRLRRRRAPPFAAVRRPLAESSPCAARIAPPPHRCPRAAAACTRAAVCSPRAPTPPLSARATQRPCPCLHARPRAAAITVPRHRRSRHPSHARVPPALQPHRRARASSCPHLHFLIRTPHTSTVPQPTCLAPHSLFHAAHATCSAFYPSLQRRFLVSFCCGDGS
jgi:hypothetical protein